MKKRLIIELLGLEHGKAYGFQEYVFNLQRYFSKFEGLGMPVVEAMSFGLPVILSDIPVHREVSMCKGDYFEPMDVETLTSMMLNISDTKRAYSDAVHEIFSEENTSAKYVELINRAWGVILWFEVEDFRGARSEIQIIAPDCCCVERRIAA